MSKYGDLAMAEVKAEDDESSSSSSASSTDDEAEAEEYAKLALRIKDYNLEQRVIECRAIAKNAKDAAASAAASLEKAKNAKYEADEAAQSAVSKEVKANEASDAASAAAAAGDVTKAASEAEKAEEAMCEAIDFDEIADEETEAAGLHSDQVSYEANVAARAARAVALAALDYKDSGPSLKYDSIRTIIKGSIKHDELPKALKYDY